MRYEIKKISAYALAGGLLSGRMRRLRKEDRPEYYLVSFHGRLPVKVGWDESLGELCVDCIDHLEYIYASSLEVAVSCLMAYESHSLSRGSVRDMELTRVMAKAREAQEALLCIGKAAQLREQEMLRIGRTLIDFSGAESIAEVLGVVKEEAYLCAEVARRLHEGE